jgi:SAM-dependent methyltransferase
VVALACHQALARSRPDEARLSEFYLWLALGGAVGGVLTALVAPVIAPTPLEYPLVLLLAGYVSTHAGQQERRRPFDWTDAAAPAAVGLLSLVLVRAPSWWSWTNDPLARQTLLFGPSLIVAATSRRSPRRYALALLALLAAAPTASGAANRTVEVMRTFYGVHRVQFDASRRFHVLMNGSTVHGIQDIEFAPHRTCSGYYSKDGPAGQVFDLLAGARAPGRVAVLGLGTGTLACYALPIQHWDFYEIDPAVVTLARDRSYFTYLKDAPAGVSIIAGDARLSLGAARSPTYDLIVLDVFSSDAIPVHLLTREAFALYIERLSSRGVLLIHVSNQYFALQPVVGALASDRGLIALARRHEVDAAAIAEGIYPSEWVALARHVDDLAPLAADRRWLVPPIGPLWTDQHASLLSAFKPRRWR